MTRIRTGAVQVDGLPELHRALKRLGDLEASRELRGANKKAAEHVRDKSKARAYMVGGVAAHVAPSLRASAGTQSAAVSGGGASHPAFAGAEFGGRGRPTTMQFQPHRGREGYFVYPTIRAESGRIVKPYQEALDQIIKKVGLA